MDHFKTTHRVIIPLLPLYDLTLIETSVSGLSRFVQKFIEHFKLKNIHLLGNSLGGHIGLVYTLKHQELVRTITLTGSSGLFENGMGETYPKRGDYNYVQKKTDLLFMIPR